MIIIFAVFAKQADKSSIALAVWLVRLPQIYVFGLTDQFIKCHNAWRYIQYLFHAETVEQRYIDQLLWTWDLLWMIMCFTNHFKKYWNRVIPCTCRSVKLLPRPMGVSLALTNSGIQSVITYQLYHQNVLFSKLCHLPLPRLRFSGNFIIVSPTWENGDPHRLQYYPFL